MRDLVGVAVLGVGLYLLTSQWVSLPAIILTAAFIYFGVWIASR